jgi:hypothetical protein
MYYQTKLNFKLKSIVLMLLVFIVVSCLGLHAQSLNGEKAVTHYFMVNIDESIQDIFSSVKPEKNIPKSKENQEKKNRIIEGIIDTFYTIASARVKEELGLELLPLNELHNKIKYSSEYPNCPKMTDIKKVLLSASGYKYYVDFYINIYSNFSEAAETSSPDRIKPLYAISFTLYDAKGKLVKKTNFSFRSKEVLVKETIKDQNFLGTYMKTNLCNYYNEALNGFSNLDKKKLTAER